MASAKVEKWLENDKLVKTNEKQDEEEESPRIHVGGKVSALIWQKTDLGFKANFEVISGTDWYFYYGCSGNNDCGIFTAGSYACGPTSAPVIYTAGPDDKINAETTAKMTEKYHNYRLKYDAFK